MWLFEKKFGKFKCPRCGKEQWFKSEEYFMEALKKGRDECIECLATLKLTVEGKKLKVERIHGKGMSDEDYQLMKTTARRLKGLELMQRGMRNLEVGSAIDGFLGGDYTGALYWNIKRAQLGSGSGSQEIADIIAYLLRRYPKQAEQIKEYFRNR